jgi:hypothetical protein
MAPEMDENALPLAEFIKLPTTVDFGIYNSESFQHYIKDKPYIKVGTKFESGFLVAYTNKEKTVALRLSKKYGCRNHPNYRASLPWVIRERGYDWYCRYRYRLYKRCI